MSIKPPTVLIAVILICSVNVACYNPTKTANTCHTHMDSQGHKITKHCHLHGNNLQHEHPYRYRNL